MSGGGGFFGGRGGVGAGPILRDMYGRERKEQIVKTLERELVERGLVPRPGDEKVVLGHSPWPKVAITLGIVLILSILCYVVLWEALPDSPGEFCPSPFERCERAK